jgi:hypothetical protein
MSKYITALDNAHTQNPEQFHTEYYNQYDQIARDELMNPDGTYREFANAAEKQAAWERYDQLRNEYNAGVNQLYNKTFNQWTTNAANDQIKNLTKEYEVALRERMPGPSRDITDYERQAANTELERELSRLRDTTPSSGVQAPLLTAQQRAFAIVLAVMYGLGVMNSFLQSLNSSDERGNNTSFTLPPGTPTYPTLDPPQPKTPVIKPVQDTFDEFIFGGFNWLPIEYRRRRREYRRIFG